MLNRLVILLVDHASLHDEGDLAQGGENMRADLERLGRDLGSAWPPVVPMAGPAVKMRGPVIQPPLVWSRARPPFRNSRRQDCGSW
jgi:hypothetical protein